MSESETKGRFRREFESYYADMQVIPNQGDRILADAIDRIAADVAAVKAKVDSVAPEDVRHFVESEKAWVALVEEQRDAARYALADAQAEVERLKAELAKAKAETQRIQDEADDREETERVKRLNAEIEKMHRTLLNRTWERDIATAEVERLRAELAAQPTAAGWLTEVERQTLLYLRSILSSWGIAPNYQEVKEFYGDLERLDAILDRAGSPPVVEVPALPERTFSPALSAAARVEAQCYRAAMDRAGVPWKEVPRE